MKKIGEGTGEGIKRTSEAAVEDEATFEDLVNLLKSAGFGVVVGEGPVRAKIKEIGKQHG